MQIKATMKPGQNGTKRYLSEYGDQLICVRYRYDKYRQKRITTVELAMDEQDWVPGVIFPRDRQVFIQQKGSVTNDNHYNFQLSPSPFNSTRCYA